MSETNNNTDSSTEDVSGLKNKNAELHRKLKAAELRAEKAEQDAEDAAENAKAETGSELDKAKRAITKLTKDLDAANKRADASDNSLRDYKASSALATAIASANVDSDHVAMLTKALRADIQFDDAGEPVIEGKSIEDFAKSYFGGAGKKYVRVAEHGGGGATGSEGAKAARMTKENFNYSEFAMIQLKNPAEANAIADAVGKPELKIQL